MNAFSQIGTIIGPSLVFFAAIHILVPLYLYTLIIVLMAVIVLKYLPESRGNLEKQEGGKLKFSDKRIRAYCFISFVVFLLRTIVMQTLGFYLQDHFGYQSDTSVQHFASALSMSAIAILLAQLGIIRYWQYHPLKLIQLGIPSTALGLCLIACTKDIMVIYISVIILSVGTTLVMQGCTVCCSYTANLSEQGSVAGLLAASNTMGMVIGPLIGGVLYSIKPGFAYFGSGLLMAGLSVFALFVSPVAVPKH